MVSNYFTDDVTVQYELDMSSGNVFMSAFTEALTQDGLQNAGYGMNGGTPTNESEYNNAINSGNLKAYDNGNQISSSLLPSYSDLASLFHFHM